MMREIVDKILEGNFDYEKGSLDFSCSKLEINIRPGEDAEGSFYIYGESGRLLEGEVISSDLRMECLTPELVGSGEEICYYFHSEGMEEGDVVRGEFYVISNQGEYYLPFVVSMSYSQIESSMGNIKNLFHFVNLAKVSPDEAMNLFYSPEFARMFTGNEKQYYQVYCGLSAYPGNRQNMEEFLISIGKKQKIEYLTGESEIRLEDPEDVTVYQLGITKNGWGYVDLKIETEGDFLFVEKAGLCDDDFLGNSCTLPIYIDSGRLHGGRNMGEVVLRSSYDEIRIPVTVVCRLSSKRGRYVLEKQRLVVQLMEFYQAFRMKKIGTATWLKETGKLVERLIAMDEKDISARLFQTQLLITEGRDNEAGWILDHVKNLLDNEQEDEPVLWAYYLYLTTLISRDELYVDKVTKQVEKIYKRNRDQWRIAWLLLYLSEEYSKSPTKKLLFLEEQFDRGCTSPVLYIEALTLINVNPALLMKLGEFEKQVLGYAAKKEYLIRDVIEQAVYLAHRMRDYSGTVCQFLTACYAVWADDSVLQEICAMLIRGNKVGPEYFKWYQRGVERNLRITRLYEYYMMSLDLNETIELPKIVLMYFSYQSSLDYERNAYLYANVHKNKENYPELYENYRETIEQFVVDQIGRMRINRDLAYLYKQVLVPRMLTREVAQNLSRLLFVKLIKTEHTGIRKVIVYQPLAGREHAYPMVNGKAYVPLFGSDYTLLFEDSRQNRYVSGVPYVTEKMMIPGRLVKDIAPLVQGQIGYDVFMCRQGEELAEVLPENVQRFRNLLSEEAILQSSRMEIGIKLLHYYYDNDRIEELDAYLDEIDGAELTAKVRGEVLKFMVLRGRAREAFELVCRFGPDHVEPKILMKMCSQMLQAVEPEEQPEMTALLNYIFRTGKYDEYILRYLVRFYRGMTREMRDIWKAAEDFEVDTWELCERMLIQMLFTGSYIGEKMQVFHCYVKGGARQEVEAAFLTQCAYDYFVKDKLTGSLVFEEMYHMYKRGECLPKLSRLAMLKYYAENKAEISDELWKVLLEFAMEMVRDGICLGFLTEYAQADSMMGRVLDKTIVEYHARPGAKAVIHYVIEHGDGSVGEYITEEMQHVYGGVCFKAFILFFGESVQYYIVEEMNGQEQLTESAVIQKSDIGSREVEGKFYFINDIVIAGTLQDYNTLDHLLEEYYYKEYMLDRLFRLI